MVKVEKYIPISFTSMAIFICYMMTFVNLPGYEIYNKIRYVMLMFVFAYIVVHYRDLKSSWVSASEKFVFFVYIALSFNASILDLGEATLRNPLIQCVGHCGILIANFLLLVIIINTGRLMKMLEIFLKTSVLVLVITDITVLMHVTYDGGNYLIGTKFAVAYHHIRTLLIFLIYVKDWDLRNKFYLALQLVLTFFMNVYMDCATGIIGTAFVLFLLFLFRKEVKIVLSPLCQVGVLALSTLFPVLYKPLMDNKLAHFIIEDIFHRKMNLTGRTRIYSTMPEIFGDHILWGDGINTNVEMCRRWGFTNIQNGMLKVMMESGLIAMLMLFLLYLLVFRRSKNSNGKAERALASYLLLMSFLSTIEITISVSSIAILLYLCVLSGRAKDTE